MAPLSELPKAIQFLLEQTQLVVPTSERDEGLRLGRSIAQYYWEWTLVGLIATLIRYSRKPWTLAAILFSVSPFILTFHGALTMLEEHIRFYIQTLPGVIVIWAILWNQGAELLERGTNTLASNQFRGKKIIQWSISFAFPLWILLQVVLGSVQTPLAPNADWRRDWDPQPSDFRDLISQYEDGYMMQNKSSRACGISIEELIKEDRPLRPTIYEQTLIKYFRSGWFVE